MLPVTDSCQSSDGCDARCSLQIWGKAEAVDMSRYENSDYAFLLSKFFRLIIKDGRTTTHTPELIGSCAPGHLVLRCA